MQLFITARLHAVSLRDKGPKAPEYPVELQYPDPAVKEADPYASESAERRQLQRQQDEKYKQFNKDNEIYNKNVSIIALVASIIFLVVSLTLFKQILVIADGVLLGGVLTLAYSIVRGFSSNDDIFRFLVVSAGLLVAMGLGYMKFVRTSKHS